MPFIKISGLTTATAVSATNQFEINQNGGSRSATVAQVAAFARTSATDPVVLPAGTVSAPALTFTGDTNTGIYSPAADTIAFSEGGVEAMRIDASGRVGINTASPTSPLEVSSTSQFSGIALTGTGRAWSVGSNSTTLVNVNYQHDAMAFTASGSERMRIAAGGNVGIGTSNPQDALHVQRTSDMGVRIESTAAAAYLSFINANAAVVNNASNTPMVFTTNNSERVRITSAGDVGIGTAGPGARLDVTNTAATHALFQLTQTNTSFNTDMALYNAANLTSNTLISKRTDGGLWFYQSGANYIASFTNALERMRITSTGNVGIGTTAPTQRLEVFGSGMFKTGNNDFVHVFSDSGAIELCRAAGDTYIDLKNSASEDWDVRLQSLGTGGTFLILTNGAESARFTSSNQLFVGTPTPRIFARISAENNGYAGYFACTGTGGGNIPLIVERYSDDGISIEFKRNNAVVGNINVTSTSTNYSSGSDYRLKENVVPLTGAAARVQALKPSRFNFIADPDRTVDGFLAHEAAEVVPEAVTGEKDAVNEDGSIKAQGIDHSKLVPLLTAALQEALAEITSLKARVAILENK